MDFRESLLELFVELRLFLPQNPPLGSAKKAPVEAYGTQNRVGKSTDGIKI